MQNELLDKANGETRLLKVAFMQSRDLCLQRYEKPMTSSDSHLLLLEKMQRRRGGLKLRTPQQMEALRLLYLWRDGMARKEDESPGYILPNHMLIQIAEILPKEAQGVLACCNPIPPLLRQHVMAVHQLIKDARHIAPSSATTKPQEIETKIPVPAKTDFDSTSLLSCPHDFSQSNKSKMNSPATSCNVILNKKSDLIGPFQSDTVRKGVALSKSDRSSCAFMKRNSDTNTNEEKLEAIVKSFWDPFMLYFPSGDKSKKSTPSNSSPNQPLTLKYMLSGNFQWKMRKLEKPEEKEEALPKTFGTKIEIPDDAKQTTEDQVQVLKSMMSKKKQSFAPAPTPPNTPAAPISMEGVPKSLRFKYNKDNLINEKFANRLSAPQHLQQQVSNKRSFPRENFSSKESKRPFQPHQYSKDEYKQFRRPKEAKKKRRPGKPKRF